jgi:hypothetical protein
MDLNSNVTSLHLAIVSSGKIPVAFFDEFDAKLGNDLCGWLKFFLMPMQDGQYSIGQDLFDLSSAAFVQKTLLLPLKRFNLSAWMFAQAFEKIRDLMKPSYQRS